jgi:hypothetical protein
MKISHIKAPTAAHIRVRIAIVIILAGTACLCLEPRNSAAASKYDGSEPFICVPTAVIECVGEGECRPGTAESENLPDFFKINLKDQTIGSEGTKRFSAIKRIDRTAKDVTLYGTESARSWVLRNE